MYTYLHSALVFPNGCRQVLRAVRMAQTVCLWAYSYGMEGAVLIAMARGTVDAVTQRLAAVADNS